MLLKNFQSHFYIIKSLHLQKINFKSLYDSNYLSGNTKIPHFSRFSLNSLKINEKQRKQRETIIVST